VVAAIFGGQGAGLSRLIYILVGLSGVYQALQFKAIQKRWGVRSEAA
jgi:uncharacterized membrane protein YuzA (DUF378 family)